MKRRAFLIGSASSAIPANSAVAQYYRPIRPEIGFIFIGASWCPYCHQAAPHLKRLAEQSDIPVLVISMDDKAIPPFEEFIFDAKHPMIGANQQIPRTALWSSSDDALIGVFDGYKSPSHYVRNLRRLVARAVNAGGMSNG